MTLHGATQGTGPLPLGRTIGGVGSSWPGRLHALALEWRSRRRITRTLGRLPGRALRDIGLTLDDCTAACADSLDRPASEALARAVQHRSGNW
jgi:uncharacterized protein YjiS (DUF1127 family)